MSLSWWSWVSAAIVLCGCFARPAEPAEPPYVQLIAVEARVELRLTACQSPRVLVACLPRPLRTLDALSLRGESFGLLGTREAGGEVFAELEALVAGEDALDLAYTDVDGRRRKLEVPLRAVDVDAVTLVADCPLTRQAREPLLIGAGSELDVRWEPRWQGGFVSTGQLPVFDFAGFELLASESHGATLRAPEAPGAHVWRDLAGADHALEVYDRGSFPLQLSRLSGSRARVGSDMGAARVCTPAGGSALVELRVVLGACAIGLGGVEAEGSLWLALAEGDTDFDVYGRGTCKIDARLDDAHEASLTIFDVAAQTPGVGTPVGSEPVPFAVTEPLPTARCDRGVTDGDCQLLVFPIPDADCLTDADWKVQLYDSAGPIGSGDYVGTSLTFSISLGITVGPMLLEGHRAPMDVKAHYDERLLGLLASAQDVHVKIGECLEPAGEARVAQVRVDAVGPHQLEFTASNINDTAEVDFAARGTDRCPIQVTLGGEIQRGGELSVLEGATLGLSARCERNDGLKLRGDTPLEISRQPGEPVDAAREALIGEARITNAGSFYAGTGPARYLVESPFGAGSRRIVVVPASEVSTLEATPLAADARRAELHCSEVTVRDAEGRLLPETPATRLRVVLPADGSWLLDAATGPRRVCVRRLREGQAGASLGLRFGGAELALALP